MVDQGHEVEFLANSYTGQTIKKAVLTDGTTFDYKIHGQRSQYFQNEMQQMLKEIKPDIFFILLDTFMLYPWLVNFDLSPARTIFWYPSDGGGGMPLGCENILRKMDCPVAMAKFGQKQVKDVYDIDTKHIPHGTEPNRYFKMSDEDRQKMKQKYGVANKFVIGTVSRNQPRKMLDRALKSFRIVADHIPEAVFLMHLDPNDPAAPWPIVEMIKKYDLENRVVFTGMSAMKAFDWEQMNEVYNAMDVFFLSTSGEGFGIPTIEAMSCEIPVVVTSYTSTAELVEQNNSGLSVQLTGVPELDMYNSTTQDYDFNSFNGSLTGSWMVERGLMDIKDAARKIMMLQDPKLREQLGSNGRKAVLEKYDFDKIVAPQWENLMKELVK